MRPLSTDGAVLILVFHFMLEIFMAQGRINLKIMIQFHMSFLHRHYSSFLIFSNLVPSRIASF